MEYFVFALISLVLLIPIIYILPLGFTIKGKHFIVVTSTVIALLSILANMTFSWWQSMLVLLLLVVLFVLVINERFNEIIFAEDEVSEQQQLKLNKIDNIQRDEDPALQINEQTDEQFKNIQTTSEVIDGTTEDETTPEVTEGASGEEETIEGRSIFEGETVLEAASEKQQITDEIAPKEDLVESDETAVIDEIMTPQLDDTIEDIDISEKKVATGPPETNLAEEDKLPQPVDEIEDLSFIFDRDEDEIVTIDNSEEDDLEDIIETINFEDDKSTSSDVEPIEQGSSYLSDIEELLQTTDDEIDDIEQDYLSEAIDDDDVITPFTEEELLEGTNDEKTSKDD